MNYANPDTGRTALDHAPDALLLDFGGVIFETVKHPQGRAELATRIVELLRRAGQPLEAGFVRRSLDAALTALKHWKHASSRRVEPRELTHREIAADFLAADYPPGPRDVLIAEAAEVLDLVTSTLSAHVVRPGIGRLLACAAERGIPLGIVSNAHSGRSHRRILAEHGLDRAFGVQVYSDEVGIRKPNPRIIELAATALGVTADRCWYVGDTLDRDVVAGRRAEVAAVVVTRSHHTDAPPFGVAAEPDAVFDTPEGLADALEAAGPARSPVRTSIPAAKPARAALLIDHGGVISHSQPDPDAMGEFAAEVARRLTGAGEQVAPAQALELIEKGRERHHLRKQQRHRAHVETGAPLAEVQPVDFWRDLVGAELPERQRAILTAEAFDLMHLLGRAKSRRILRTGVRELLETCRDAGLAVVVVSNTINGRAVRAQCAEHDLDGLIGAYVCSDEAGVRKPDPTIVREALRVAAADPARTWFYGDKPENDAEAARACGITHRVIVRGGSTPDETVDRGLTSGLVTTAVPDAGQLAALIAAEHRTDADA